MVIRNMKSGRRLAVIALFAILAMSAFGFAASNVVPETNAGDGNELVSGGNVTSVNYNVDANGQIASVSFTYTTTNDPDNARVALLDAPDGNVLAWSSNCSLVAGVYTCPFGTPEDIGPVGGLRVLTFD